MSETTGNKPAYLAGEPETRESGVDTAAFLAALEPVAFNADALTCRFQANGEDRTRGIEMAIAASAAASLKRIADYWDEASKTKPREETMMERSIRRDRAAGNVGRPPQVVRTYAYDALRAAFPDDYRAAILAAEGVVLSHGLSDHKLCADIEFAIVSTVATAKGLFR